MRKILLNFLLVLISFWGFGQETFTFTNCGATGRTGPTQTQVNTAYSGTNLQGNVTINTQGIQEWTVPTTGDYAIEVYGAEGGWGGHTTGDFKGGNGAKMYGEFSFTAGTVLKILVGQQGSSNITGKAGGGGGGSFVVLSSGNTPLIVAAGGGGGGYQQTMPTWGYGKPGLSAIGNGNGGSNTYGPGSEDQAGAGFNTNGWSGINTTSPAKAFVNGGEGGDFGTTYGGFGGGGAGGNSYPSGGGGGGYQGGEAPGSSWDDNGVGQGGLSYNSGINQNNADGVNLGNGSVIITRLCSPITVEVTPGENVYIGTEVTITGTSANGGTITWDNGITNGVPFTANATTTYNATSDHADDCATSQTITVNAPNGLDFDGVDDKVIIPDNNALDLTNNYTIECWMKPSAFNWLGGLVSKHQTGGSGGYTLRLTGDAPYNGIDFDEMKSDTGLFETNRWYHIAAVNDNGTRHLYINGEEVALTGTPLTVQSNADHLTIGEDFNEEGTRLFNGEIDEVRIWNDVRTAEEINANMDTLVNPTSTNLVAYYRFDQTSGAVLEDLTVNNLDGTLTNMEEQDWTESYALVTPRLANSTNNCLDLTINWNAVKVGVAEKYYLELATDRDFTSFVTGYNPKDMGTSLTESVTVPAHGKYYFRVRAFKASTGDVGAIIGVDSINTDTENPNLIVQNFTAELDASGNVSITAADLVTTGTDNCTVQDTTLDISAFTCDNIGDNNVEVTLTDINGNSVNQTAVVTVEDNINPTLAVQNITVELDDSGNATITAADLVTTGTDNCTIQDTTLDVSSFTCSNIGANNVVVTLTDVNGNETEHTAVVTIEDNENPTFTAVNTTVQLDENGSVTLDKATLLTDVSDNCGIQDTTISPASFTCTEVGAQNVTVTLIDVNNNQTQHTAVVTVEDNIAPTADVVSKDTLYLDASGNGTVTENDIISNVNDNCTANPNVALINNTFTCENIGVVAGWESLSGLANENYKKNAFYSDGIDIFMVGSKTADNSIEVLKWNGADWDVYATLPYSVTANYLNITKHSNGNMLVNVINSDSKMCLYVYNTNTTTWSELVSANANTAFNLGSTYNAASFATNPINDEIWITFVPSSSGGGTYAPNVLKYDGTNISLVGYPRTGITSEWSGISDITFTNNGTPVVAFGAMNNAVGPFVATYDGASWNSQGVINGIQGRAAAVQIIRSTNNDIYFAFRDITASKTYLLKTTDFSSWTEIVNADVSAQYISLSKLSNNKIYLRYDNKGILVKDGVAEDITGTTGSTLVAAKLFEKVSGGYLLFGNYNYNHNYALAYQYNLGNSVNYEITDDANNTTTGSVEILVLDTVSPTFTAVNTTVQLDENGSVTLDKATLLTDAADACGIEDTTISPVSFTCNNIGENNVTVTLSDVNGNETSHVAVVTVEDDINPTFTAVNTTVQLDENGSVTLDKTTLLTGASDNCGIQDTTISPVSFTCAEVGEQTVTITLTDVNNNETELTATVTVEDDFVPVVSTNDITLYLDETGNASITNADAIASIEENCEVQDTTLSQYNFGCDDAGHQPLSAPGTIFVTVTDVNDNEQVEDFIVTVLDTIAPTLTVKDITVQLDTNGNVTLNKADLIETNSVADACGIQDTSLNITSFDCEYIGENEVIVTVSDIYGNETKDTAIVTVEDLIIPAITALDITLYLDETGNASITPADVVDEANDACGIADTTLNNDTFSCEDIGFNIVTVTVTDENDNQAQDASVITIEDNLAPTFTVQNITVQLDENGQVEIDKASLLTEAYDNCAIQDTTIDISSFTCDNVGENEVVVTLTDVNENETQQTAIVTVEDNVNPILETNAIAIFLNESGVATVDKADLVNLASDNCEVADTSLSISTFTCEHVNDFNGVVQVTITDNNGNSVMDTAYVEVIDTISPSFTANDLTVQLDENGEAMVDKNLLITNDLDACGIQDTTFSKLSFTCEDAGVDTVIITLTDVNDNATIDTAFVTVEDNIDPVLETTDLTVYLDESGEVSITNDSLVTNATDNCTIADTTLSQYEFGCNDIDAGNGNVTVTLTDIYGNETVNTVTVTVLDTIDPSVEVENTTVYLDANGQVSIELEDVVVGSSNACGIAETNLSTDNFDCSNVGENDVTVTVIDNYGNETQEVAVVTVLDTINPYFEVQDLTVQLDENGQVMLNKADLLTNASDICGIADTTLNNNEFNCENIGENEVIVTLTDVNDNALIDTAIITVEDNLAPEFTYCPQNIVVCEDDNMVEFDMPTATDNCELSSLELTEGLASGSEFPAGTTTNVYTAVDAQGNESECVFTVTVTPVYDYEQVVSLCEGDSIQLSGAWFYEADEITEYLSTEAGCDSTVRTTIEMIPSYEEVREVEFCQGSSVDTMGTTITEAGTYEFTFEAQNTCDSIIIIEAIELPSYNLDRNIGLCAGDSILINDEWITESGEYVANETTVNGCDSIVNISLTIDEQINTAIAEAICPGDSLFFAEEWLTEEGDYQEYHQAASGCDSIVTLTLSYNPTHSEDIAFSICEGDSVMFGSQWITEAGVFEHTFENEYGCDSLVTATVELNEIDTTYEQITLCSNDTIYIYEAEITEAGNYTFIDQSLITGCDSVVIVQVEMIELNNTEEVISVCSGESADVFGNQETEAGVYEQTFTSVETGCDSTHTITLEVIEPYNIEVEMAICDGEEVIIGGNTYNSDDVIVENLTSVITGCDSTVTTTLTVAPSISLEQSVTLCAGDSIEIGGVYYDEAGEYATTETAVNGGCDSTMTYHVDIADTYDIAEEVTICEGDSALIGDVYYSEEGEYAVTYETIEGCDSIITTNLIITAPVVNDVYVSLCEGDTYFAEGADQSEAGTYTDMHDAASGCDSIVYTHISVNEHYTIHNEIPVCEGDSVMVLNQWYTEEATVIEQGLSMYDCDSLVFNHIILNPVYELNVTQSICANDSIELEDAWQTESGVYYDTLETQNWCDSIIVTDLTVNPVYFDVQDFVICEGDSVEFQGNWLTTEGFYHDSLEAVITGCDSVFHANLTVVEYPEVNLGPDTTLCAELSIDLDAGTAETYEWTTGGTTQVETVDSNLVGGLGEHEIVVTAANGECAVSDTIVVTFDICDGIEDVPALSISMYPNPTQDYLYINAETNGHKANVYVMDAIGKVIYTTELNSDNNLERIDFTNKAKGVYYVKVVSEGITKTEKVIFK